MVLGGRGGRIQTYSNPSLPSQDSLLQMSAMSGLKTLPHGGHCLGPLLYGNNGKLCCLVAGRWNRLLRSKVMVITSKPQESM